MLPLQRFVILVWLCSPQLSHTKLERNIFNGVTFEANLTNISITLSVKKTSLRDSPCFFLATCCIPRKLLSTVAVVTGNTSKIAAIFAKFGNAAYISPCMF